MKISLDFIFKNLTRLFGLIICLIFISLLYVLMVDSLPVFQHFGFSFFTNVSWDPVKGVFGALPFIYGTLLTATLSLLVAIPLSIGIAVFLTEMIPRKLREIFTTIIELIAAIPSVVIGLWGIYVLAPIIKDLQPLYDALSFIPLFSGRAFGLCYLTAIVVLTFMILPIMASIFKEAFENVPVDFKEALYALGATRYEVIRCVSIPQTKTAIAAGIILAYGRALGETLAVTMVIGNKPNITLSLLNPGYTLSAVIANEFLEATNRLYISSLIGLGLILLLISLIVNAIGTILLRRLSK